MNLGLSNIYHSWFAYRKGKKPSYELDYFQYHLYGELASLCRELNNDTYMHGAYRKFIVSENKRREVSVSSIRDRVVHRLLYDYLNPVFNKTFIFDAWSCRMGKGLMGAIERGQNFIGKYSSGYVWRADVSKFFDNINHGVLITALSLKIHDEKALSLLGKVIASFSLKEGAGVPIGNLTSQIFSNIYLNELDRFVKHYLGVKSYLRYGDDFVIFERNKVCLTEIKIKTTKFIENNLKLKLHPKNNLIIKTKSGLKFLGVILYPNGRKLNNRTHLRIKKRLNSGNSGSYWGIISKHDSSKKLREFQWKLLGYVPQ